MATNKECLIVVLDIRQSANENFKQRAVKCASEILKDKICGAKKDYVSFILVGTEATHNDLNSNTSKDDYQHMMQYPTVQECTWHLLVEFYKFVNQTACNAGEWPEALVLAMEILKSSEEMFKFQRSRIALFYDFNDMPNSYDQFNVIADSIRNLNIELMIISENIAYIDDAAEDGEPEAIFANAHKTSNQLKNELHALSLASDCNAKLCNFTEALNTIFRVENRRPHPWNANLYIGTKICIRITGIIAVKDESKIKMRKVYGTPEQQESRELKSFLNGKEIEPLLMDMIDGYMLGATPIPYEDTTLDEERPEKGLKFLGFTKRKSIPDEYFCGASMYTIVHQKGAQVSARKLDALVQSLLKLRRVMLCWKIYSEKYNHPKIVVLIPDKYTKNRPATLTMIEHTYYEQHIYWNFPSLAGETAKCKDEQLDAIDDLIDSMDLMISPKEAKERPRDTTQSDLLPYDCLPHIFEQNIMDVLERKILCNASEDDEQFQEMLKDKNFVDVFWKVPETIEEKAKTATNKLKALFPLERSAVPLQRLKEQAAVKVETPAKEAPTYTAENDQRPFIDTFQELIEQHVNTIANSTARDAKYQLYAAKMRAALWDSLRRSTDVSTETEIIGRALLVYRRSAHDFQAIDDYNEWIRDVKAWIVQQKHYDFWRDVIVRGDLGICVFGEPSLDEKLAIDDFYRIEGDHIDDDNDDDDQMDNVEIDKLLANLP